MPTPEEIQVVRLALFVALAVVACSAVPGVAVGVLLARWRSRWAWAVRGVVLLPLVLPPVVTGYGLLLLFGRSAPLGRLITEWTGGHVAYTTGACVLAAAVVGFPLFVESVRLAVVGVDPRFEQVARTLGRGRIATFRHVTFPLILPGVLAGAALTFARALGEFGATIVLAGNVEGETRQIPLAVYTLMNTPGNEAAILRLALVSVALSLASMWAVAFLSRRRDPREPAR